MMCLSRKAIVLILCCAVLLLMGGCSKGPEATVKAYFKAVINGKMSIAASYTDNSPAMAEWNAPVSWGHTSYADRRLFFKHCTSTVTEFSDSSAKVIWRIDFRGMEADAVDSIQDYGFTAAEAEKVRKYLDVMSVMEFTLEKTDTKWKITCIDLPDIMNIAPQDIDLDLLKRMEQIR